MRALSSFVLGGTIGIIVCLLWILLFYVNEDWWLLTPLMAFCPGLLAQVLIPLEATGIWVVVANILAVTANGVIYGLAALVIVRSLAHARNLKRKQSQ